MFGTLYSSLVKGVFQLDGNRANGIAVLQRDMQTNIFLFPGLPKDHHHKASCVSMLINNRENQTIDFGFLYNFAKLTSRMQE